MSAVGCTCAPSDAINGKMDFGRVGFEGDVVSTSVSCTASRGTLTGLGLISDVPVGVDGALLYLSEVGGAFSSTGGVTGAGLEPTHSRASGRGTVRR